MGLWIPPQGEARSARQPVYRSTKLSLFPEVSSGKPLGKLRGGLHQLGLSTAGLSVAPGVFVRFACKLVGSSRAVSLGDSQHCRAHSLYNPFPFLFWVVPENTPRPVGVLVRVL